ncbi:hypothetical protein LOS78_01650 [Paracoccus sp. MA]|uniref:hypothetical protein n=1 Tax=Paracoccus sp. MA TaxID=2895796 RepID=UPI001E3E8AFD|nr:hypothetical protein [Paracoccus sp. MA]UFM64203.1 hypothetical protein LOS78_01650 [Paracoccus sp. MA]
MSHPAKFWMVKGDGPASAMHGTREAAEGEAARLARMNPGTLFFVMEAVACHRRVEVERIALDGKPDPRDELPF